MDHHSQVIRSEMMNPSELAAKMLQWEKDKRALDQLTVEIEEEVLKIQKTQVVGNVRVTYSGGRATYDYEKSAYGAPGTAELEEKYSTEKAVVNWDAVAAEVPDVVEKYTSISIAVDWKAVCDAAKIKPIVVSKTEPTAKIKLEG
jgi:hypothetical protein